MCPLKIYSACRRLDGGNSTAMGRDTRRGAFEYQSRWICGLCIPIPKHRANCCMFTAKSPAEPGGWLLVAGLAILLLDCDFKQFLASHDDS
jgi:hypothetical protein